MGQLQSQSKPAIDVIQPCGSPPYHPRQSLWWWIIPTIHTQDYLIAFCLQRIPLNISRFSWTNSLQTRHDTTRHDTHKHTYPADRGKLRATTIYSLIEDFVSTHSSINDHELPTDFRI